MKTLLLTLGCLLAWPALSLAHFPWLTVDDNGHALLFFSESMLEREYHTPDCVEQAKVERVDQMTHSEIALTSVEEEGFLGRRSVSPVGQHAVLTSTIKYGVYHGTLLEYFVKRVPMTDTPPKMPAGSLPLNATPINTDDGINLLVLWHDEPLADAQVTLIDGKSKQAQGKTDDQGVVRLTPEHEGPVAFLVNHSDQDARGEFAGEKFTSKTYVLTLTSAYRGPAADAKPEPSAESRRPEEEEEDEAPPAVSDLPELPQAIASFGATVCEGWLYVYGGHTGKEHHHSRENLSAHFSRLKIEGGDAWEELPMQTPLQGLPLVTHAGKLYRIGGMTARNEPDAEEEDLHSSAEFACFEPTKNQWEALPSLPAGRSSHDATVIGDSLYVVGGWNLHGEAPGDWQTTALVYDFTTPERGWREIKSPPFERRALAVSHRDGKLVAIGGMASEGGVVNSVSQYDPQTDEWSELPDLPGKGISGFGVSAWNHQGQLYASGMGGKLFTLPLDGGGWQEVRQVDEPRFFHRLLSCGAARLVQVAGASPVHGHVATLDVIELPRE
ncbi:MAG: hypothetical protein KDA37_03720 [Planctomycetales bacterium]|nr:hypothetical protein [Planctomycetales bacterium]